jgi:hypothetical protein
MQEEEKGGFLFISHSHKDMDKVRELRNKLEDEGYEPLCFYLKCLDDNTKELDDLIKREIDARQWFVYAVSENSRKSEWVQKECDWRTREDSENKQILNWDLESGISVDEVSKELIRGLRVYISFSHRDLPFVRRLKEKLKEKDLQVTAFTEVDLKKDYTEEIITGLDEASECGTVVVVLSSNSVESIYMLKEVRYAYERGSMIFPVFIDDVRLPESWADYLDANEGIKTPNHMSFAYLSPSNLDEEAMDAFIDEVVGEIARALDEKFNQ